MNDLLFKQEDFVFSYRVGGILINDGKILLQKPKNDDYAIIGGHVSAFETTEETLVREFKEELNADIQIEKLMAIGEIFFPWGNKPCHQICLYYKVHLLDDSVLLTSENDIDYIWVAINKINHIKLYPEEIKTIILENQESVSHFISKQI